MIQLMSMQTPAQKWRTSRPQPAPGERWADRDEPPLLVIVGPTAVGKTSIAVQLAEEFDGEIVSADSRQLYEGMDIGTASPTPAEQARATHHMIDVLQPDERMTLAEFQDSAYDIINDVLARKKLPVLAGGTGLYVRAVVEGYGIPRVAPDQELRARLRAEAEEHGQGQLYARLQAVDPGAAEKIHPNNVRRVIRALEVYEKSGHPISELQRKVPPPYDILQLGLTRDRETLYERVDMRIQQMLDAGLIDEVRRLLDAGYTPANSEAMTGLGYQETVAYLRGEIESEEELARAIGQNTRDFIRHQYGWFRLNDPDIHWFDLGDVGYEAIRSLVNEWLDR